MGRAGSAANVTQTVKDHRKRKQILESGCYPYRSTQKTVYLILASTIAWRLLLRGSVVLCTISFVYLVVRFHRLLHAGRLCPDGVLTRPCCMYLCVFYTHLSPVLDSNARQKKELKSTSEVGAGGVGSAQQQFTAHTIELSHAPLRR